MNGEANEFARPARIDTIGEQGRSVSIAAEAEERTALAHRFGLVALDRLEADIEVRRAGEIVHATGRVRARATQACVATGTPVEQVIDVPMTLRFVPDAQAPTQEEKELDSDDCDTIGYDGASVDLGEAAAETLYLALDPFPRAADADAVLKAAGVLGEEDAGPFAALKGLRDRLAGGSA